MGHYSMTDTLSMLSGMRPDDQVETELPIEVHTSIKVLEEACNKKGFLPTSEYELKHGPTKKALDLTLTVRFAGLPNHAKLEMVKASQSRQLSNVVIALQLESGDRITRDCKPTITLWEILEDGQKNSGQNLTGSPEGTHPVCVYMREEVVGEYALRNTTLHDMGLISGRAILRLISKPLDNDLLNEIRQKIDKEKSRKAALAAKGAALHGGESDPLSVHTNDSTVEAHVSPQLEAMETAAISESSSNASQSISSQSGASQHSDRVPDSTSSWGADSTSCVRLEEAMSAEAVDTEPMDVEDRTCSSVPLRGMPVADTPMESEVNEEPQSSTLAGSGRGGAVSRGSRPTHQAQPDTSIPGVQIFRPGEMNLSPAQEQMARQLAEAIMPGVFPERSEVELERLRREREKRLQQKKAARSRQPQAMIPAAMFTEFKFPEETKGKDLYNNELSDRESDDYKPCDRETVLYCLDDVVSSSAVPTEPDEDFFEVTETDIKKMWSDLQRSLVEQSDQPLMTQAMRKSQTESRLGKYGRVFIRFTFPDKFVLQGTFRPRETVYSLYKFVKEYLEDKSMPFYLYTSPPKKLLEDNTLNLMETKLVPMTVVYFGSEVKKEHYLSSATLKEKSAQSAANEVLVSHLPSSTSSAVPPGGQGTKRSTPQGQDRSPSQSTGDGKKIPKWFKVGKK